ncbi:MAG: two-component regulator propeller domain-containing protein [bacterium]
MGIEIMLRSAAAHPHHQFFGSSVKTMDSCSQSGRGDVSKFCLGRLVILVLLLSALNYPIHLSAQSKDPPTIDVSNIKIEWLQELRGSTVGCILQDRQGFIWFGGTIGGLHKYDGYGFTVYRNDVRDSNSLSDNTVMTIYEDRSGTLWIGTRTGGLNRFDREQEQFTRFVNNPSDPQSLTSGPVRCIFEDRLGTLWVGTERGLNRFDRVQEQFSRFVHAPNDTHSLRDNWVRSIVEDRSGTLWVAGVGLHKLDRATGQVTRFAQAPHAPHSPSDSNLSLIHEGPTGTLWIAQFGAGLYRFDPEQETFNHFVHDPDDPTTLSSNRITSIQEGRSGALWVGTEGGGLNRLDRATGQFARFVHDPNDPSSLSSNYIMSILEDHTGALWVGTGSMWGRAPRGGFGINRYDPGQNQFGELVLDPANLDSLPKFGIQIVHEDRTGILWIGTRGDGLIERDRATGRARRYIHDPEDPHSLSQNWVFSLYEDRSGTLWVGTFDRGLNRFDRGTRQFARFAQDRDDPTSLSHNRVVSMLEDRSGTLWFTTFGGGLNRFDREREQFTRFVHDPDDPYSLSDDHATGIYEDRNGTLWVGTWGGGLNRLDREQETFIRFVHNPDDPTSLSNNVVSTIHEDRAGTLWVGTSGGLNKLDRSTGQFHYYTEKEGLPDNSVGGILEDNQGRLWLSTHGLSRFDPQSGTVRNYGVEDGLLNGSGSLAQGKSGEMFFCGDNGIDYFHPDSIRDNPHTPSVVITSFARYNSGEAEGSPIVVKGISEKRHLELSYEDRTLSFEFVALNFRNAPKNQYAYKLEGFNEDWIQLGRKRDVSFTNLDSGEYTLRVKGSNNDGVWNEEGASLKITITPPLWKTWWAYSLYAGLILGSLYGLRRYELNRQQLKHSLELETVRSEKLKELDTLKSQFFANISHEFRTPLTLILGPIEQITAKIKEGELKQTLGIVQRNARRLLRLINQLLDLSRLESGKMQLRAAPGDIVGFLKGLTMTFASLAERQLIGLQFYAEEEELELYFDRDKVEKIFTNLLSNAFKFTPAGGEIEVTVGQSTTRPGYAWRQGAPVSRVVTITVVDTGIGIAADRLPNIFDRFYQVDGSHIREHEGSGIGLALVKELIEIHTGSISVTSEEGKGTTFTITLPMGKKHFKPEEIVATSVTVTPVQADFDLHSFESLKDTEAVVELEPYGAELDDDNIVLVVEDHADFRTYLREYLEPPYKVIEAKDGTEGLQCALDVIPDLVISDVMMPKMNGYDLCTALKTDERSSHIPVILLTAKASDEDKVEGLETGADDYLRKPFDAKELVARVKNLITLREKLRQRFIKEVVLKPSEIAVTPADEVFVKKVLAVVEEYLADEEFNVEVLQRKVGMSRTQLHRKLKALTNQSTTEFIRSIRLQRGADLLQQKAGSIAEIAYMVGFSSQAYFTRCFQQQFGMTPKTFAKQQKSKG